MKRVEEEFSVCEEGMEVEFPLDGGIQLGGKVGVEELFKVGGGGGVDEAKSGKRLFGAKPGRKPGKRKKNRTGWPLTRNRRGRREHVTKEEEIDDSTVDSVSVQDSDVCEEIVNSTDSVKKDSVEEIHSENNNQNDQSSISEVNEGDRVKNDRSEETNDKVLTNKVNNSDGFNLDLQYQPYVRVQKLDRNHIDNKREDGRRSNSPKRTNRGQRRMPASPKSPRMLRRPRGRWYRER